MNLSTDPIMRRLHACVEAGVPAIMWSDPGGGKTARVDAYSRIRRLMCKRWLLSRCEPIDLKPRIYHEGKVVVVDPPEIEALVEVAARKLGVVAAIVFFDELNRATRETEGAALDRIDNSPPGVAVIAAGNPPSRGQAARSLEAAAANRFCHLDVPTDAVAFSRAQVNGWPSDEADFPVPEKKTLDDCMGKARMLVSTFIARQPGLLAKCPDNPVQAGKAWPSPRTWEHARKLYAMGRAMGLETQDMIALVCGAIGDGAGVEFMAYCEYADLVDPEEWLAKPTAFLPDRVDKVVAALSAVAHAVKSNLDDKRWRAAWQIIEHVVSSGMMDAGMVAGDLLVNMYRAKDLPADVKAKLAQPHKLMPQRMAQLLVTP
jgi:hypothetical protein